MSSLFDCKKSSNPTTSVSTFLKTLRGATVQPYGWRLRHLVVESLLPQDEEPWLARMLVIRLIEIPVRPEW